MTTLSLSCPLCGAAAEQAPPECPGCRAALDGYWRMFFRPWLAYNRALELAAEGKHGAAARAAAKAVALEPTRFEFQLLLARLLGRLGQIEEAIEHARAAEEARPDSPEAERVLAALFEKHLAPADGAQAGENGRTRQP